MRKAELIKALEKYDDDAEIYMSFQGAKSLFWTDRIIEERNQIVIEAEDVPEFMDIAGMAEACFEEHKKTMDKVQINILSEISTKADRYYQTHQWDEIYQGEQDDR